MSTKLQATADRIAGHIRQPLTAGEIAEKIDSGDYDAEQMLQHALLLALRLERERQRLDEHSLMLSSIAGEVGEVCASPHTTTIGAVRAMKAELLNLREQLESLGQSGASRSQVSDTPGTDAASDECHNMPAECSPRIYVRTEFARKLERERNEARRLAEQWMAAATGSPVNWSLIRPLPWEESKSPETP